MSQIEKYFRTSNLIEGVDDEAETQKAVEAYEVDMDWIEFHASLGHLNDYCVP